LGHPRPGTIQQDECLTNQFLAEQPLNTQPAAALTTPGLAEMLDNVSLFGDDVNIDEQLALELARPITTEPTYLATITSSSPHPPSGLPPSAHTPAPLLLLLIVKDGWLWWIWVV
jgi:hypothetical protein